MAQRVTVDYINGNRRAWILREGTRLGSADAGVLQFFSTRGEVRVPYRNVESVEVSRD